MKFMILSLALLISPVVFALAGEPTDAPAPKTNTIITIEGMHCTGCAKKVAKKLDALKQVASAKVDVKTSKATVVPEKGKTLSPKLLWETVEAADYTPTKLKGPSGTFSKKPQS